MTDGVIVACGPCFVCRDLFAFDPEQVPSVPIDPETGLPPDLGGDYTRAIAQPICPGCCQRANVERRKRGLPLFLEGDTLPAPPF